MNLDTTNNICDVLVIGAGPAGTTVSSLLVEKGHKVVVLEKDHHPRFHIGESLLPATLPLLRRLGVEQAVKEIGVVKPGAEFVSPIHAHTQIFEFANAWDKSMPYSYQVERSRFDEILAKNAKHKGVDVREGCRVTQVKFPQSAADPVLIHAQPEDGAPVTWQARFLVDASGRDTFLGNAFKIKSKNPKHASAAVFGHFHNARRLAGAHGGNISVFWFEHGWFWFIPLKNDITSVGLVTKPYHLKTRQNRSLSEFLMDNIALCPSLADRLKEATPASETRVAGNFSYSCQRSYGRNYVMLGDAFAFIDPVFSSGVHIATQGGFFAADAIDQCLAEPAQAPRILKKLDARLRHGPKHISWFIFHFPTPAFRQMFMQPRNIFRTVEAMLSILAGDIYDKTPIWRSLRLFKTIYYLESLRFFASTVRAWRARRMSVRMTQDT